MTVGQTQQDVLATAAQVAKATGGTVVAGDPAAVCTKVSTDSRQAASGAIFIALTGENFDGARFAAQAVEGGAGIVMAERAAHQDGRLGAIGSAAVVLVKDVLVALGDLAAWHRRRFDARVVGITGSNGKTSTKQMVASVLGGAPTVLFNRGNFNNLIGMPRALLSLRAEHKHAVLEMGMNAPGEIARLAQIAGPQLGVILNAHPVHLEGLGSLEAVAQAKAELAQSLPATGTVVLNADDPLVVKFAGQGPAKKVFFGRLPTADVRIEQCQAAGQGLEVSLAIDGAPIHFRLSRPGRHNALNAAAAAAVGWVEGVEPERIAERLEQADLPALRMEPLAMGPGHLLVDCYNANPRSTVAAMQTVVDLAGSGSAYALLGDMRELGAASQELHRQVGHAAGRSGLRGLCAFGRWAQDLTRAAAKEGMTDIASSEDLDEAVAWAREKVAAGAWVLLKGSRAMRLEEVARRLASEHGMDWPPGQEGE